MEIINTIQDQLKERFSSLPKAVQSAIGSSGVEKHLRELSEVHKLHLDQWQKLENEVMLTLLGLDEAENLEENIKKHVGLPDDIAAAITSDIAQAIFHPIRLELERELTENPNRPEPNDADANIQKIEQPKLIEKEKSIQTELQPPRETTLAQNFSERIGQVVQKLLPSPSTPPPPPPSEKATRGEISKEYKPAASSSSRPRVEDDPYREPIL